MSDRITATIPQARPVQIGGKVFQVWPARLRDLIEIQGWLDARQPDPAADLDARIRGLSGVELDRVLFTTFAALADPPSFADAEGNSALMTAAGLGVFLRVALTRGHPDITDEAVAEILATLTLDELTALQTAFYRPSAMKKIERLLGMPEPRPSGEPMAWSEAIDQVAVSHGWTYEYVYSLTVAEFLNARRGGKPVEVGFRLPNDKVQAFQDRMCLALHGKTAAEHFGVEPQVLRRTGEAE